MSRTDTIAAVLRRPRLTRPLVAHELRERLVQGLEPGGTASDWTATVPQLAEAINNAVEKAERAEQKDTRGRAQRPTGGATARTHLRTVKGGHALVIEQSEGEIRGACQCGRRLGTIAPHALVDILAAKWEHHAMTEVPHG
ncbi:hypothetical protein [Streptomyces sp. STCH 565 A]|uniref:hypothetical protein n=1 Tax=Streptomyces sp. STCH 565 A TaxID=2950532 RepID=UPI0020761EAE|nr:hypothetical protein [Streptomyces sp. STCH 565 A]MCM8548952.1 hypothetical protein [Streptomyces sp. STCH 565 A]